MRQLLPHMLAPNNLGLSAARLPPPRSDRAHCCGASRQPAGHHGHTSHHESGSRSGGTRGSRFGNSSSTSSRLPAALTTAATHPQPSAPRTPSARTAAASPSEPTTDPWHPDDDGSDAPAPTSYSSSRRSGGQPSSLSYFDSHSRQPAGHHGHTSRAPRVRQP